MAKVSTTIKGVYMRAILNGTKRTEYKAFNDFWRKRLLDDAGSPRTDFDEIVFLCGREDYHYKIKEIEIIDTPDFALELLGTKVCFAIRLGEKIVKDG